MELKLNSINIRSIFRQLLIVPYGIETSKESAMQRVGELLIVPYGIETRQMRPI